MNQRWITNVLLLLLLTGAFIAVAARPYFRPVAAQADSSPYPFYIEPGTQMLRAPDGSKQVLGRVVVDMRNGEVWGFPTTSTDVYPTSAASSKPPVSHPFPLGRFAFEDANKSDGR